MAILIFCRDHIVQEGLRRTMETQKDRTWFNESLMAREDNMEGAPVKK